MNRHLTYWTEVEAIFEAVADLDDASRAALLDARCGNRPDLRAEVESLLAADAQAEGFIEPAQATAADPLLHSAPGVGSVIGPFRLIEAIGAGGMGTVYRAERADGGFTQQVAVKIIATPVSHSGAARRFRAERQILASLAHPHIVSLIDGGVTSDGHAHLVMEYVDGVRITSYCGERALPLADRLRLFRAVCSAVHYAHRHAVVHRDLKPANILVTAEGVPKVLDFGVAKLLDASTAVGATATGVGQGPLTPNYASPEQLRGLPVTTSSDVYALGVLLYELVSGVRPYETDGKPLDEVMRLVVEADPRRPSASGRANLSDTRLPYDPTRALGGDLDAIVLRAMAKQPEARYGSAEELAEDVGRFLAGVPVVAREASLGYVMRKLATRHKAAFVSIAVSFAFIVAALIVAIWQAQVATAERQRAEQRFGEVRQLANALIFEIHDAVAPLAGSTPVRRTIVARALSYLERLAGEAQGDPALQLELARAYIQIGRVQGVPGSANLGDREGAIRSFEKAQSLIEPLVQSQNPAPDVVENFIEATRRLSSTLLPLTGRSDEAISQARKAVAVADAYHRRRPTDVKARNLLASSSFAAATSIGWPDSLADWKRAGVLYDSLLADHPDNPDNMRNVALVEKYLGAIHEREADFVQALGRYERARVLDEKRLSQEPTNRQAQLDLAIDLSNVANIQFKQGNPAAAVMFEQSLAIRQSLATSDPKDEFARNRVAYMHGKLAVVYEKMPLLSKAFEHARAAIKIYESVHADRSTAYDFADVLRTIGRMEQTLARRNEACAAYERSFNLFNALPVGDRARAEGDPLPDVAALAAACGTKAAQVWLASAKAVR